MSTSFLIFAGIIVLLTIGAYRYADRKLTRRFQMRPSVDPSDWLRSHLPFPDQRQIDVANEILSLIGERLRISPAQLRPDDKLATDLNYRGLCRQLLLDGPLDDMELDLISLLEERGIEGVSFENCDTLSALLIEVCQHLPKEP